MTRQPHWRVNAHATRPALDPASVNAEVREPRLPRERGGDALLGLLVVGARLHRELADAVEGLLDAAAGALPFGPQLLEAGLGDALPFTLKRRDLAGELREGGLDVGGAGVQLAGHGLELLRGDSDVRHATGPPV